RASVRTTGAPGHFGVRSSLTGLGRSSRTCYLSSANAAMVAFRVLRRYRPVTSLGQKTVLVIEDDPWTRTITTALLTGEGFAVVEAKNGEEGLKQARAQAPDAILLDLALPTKSGLDVLRERKADTSTQATPVIV